MGVQPITDESFVDDVLSADIPVLVDFWAEWCGPCKAISPILDKLAGTYEGKVKLVKLNVDEAQTTAAKYNIRSIPTLVLFKNGEVIGTHIGGAMEGKIVAFIDESLSQAS